ncbi:hypothetical protein WH52_03280 [Tenacibaculum holothuriorum]|uniref:WD40 repeat protein n=1 Tax=Tenacibaculum holothuriorum TaxID=1635173 RepID=A0A1Y2PE15_9FLAO|nr:PD40 domain-containing protein [Tenacibaculum holothuriorum]OSY88712.1 hypothetical protein WH52_03280 [Tenacibaculum holothuriorum]
MKYFLLFFFAIQFATAQDPEIFSPEIFKDLPNVRDFALNKNGDELYFTIESYRKEYSFIAVTHKINGKWSNPKVASFSGQFKDLEPFLSPDGLTLFFASNRKTNNSNEAKNDVDIWYVKRSSLKSPWSEPINIGSIINTSANEFYPSVTQKGDLFFTAEYPNSKGKEDIYVSRFVDGKYTTPVSLSSNINSNKYEFNAFVAPDESFIIFTSNGHKNHLGRGDLYISKKDKNNNWLPAEHLGKKINSRGLDYCPFVDINSNTLYFTATKSNIKKSFSEKKGLDEILNFIDNNPNGLSRIYKTSLTEK